MKTPGDMTEEADLFYAFLENRTTIKDSSSALSLQVARAAQVSGP